jgi:hypothetical protein
VETTNCRSIEKSLKRFLGATVKVSTHDAWCVVSLPLRTLDHRSIDVFIETQHGGDFVLIHDGGKATAELYAQGIHLTESKERTLTLLAGRYGATFARGMFSIGCHAAKADNAVLAISQCASLAMMEVLGHAPVADEESAASRVGKALRAWKPGDFRVDDSVSITGATNTAHVFDFVAVDTTRNRRNVGVKVLTPTYGPHVQAHRYGFMALDLAGSMAEKWPRLAVVTKSDRWTDEALRLVKSLSARTLEVPSGDEERIEEEIPREMDELTRAA